MAEEVAKPFRVWSNTKYHALFTFIRQGMCIDYKDEILVKVKRSIMFFTRTVTMLGGRPGALVSGCPQEPWDPRGVPGTLSSQARAKPPPLQGLPKTLTK